MFPYDGSYLLTLHNLRAAELRAEAARFRLIRQVQAVPAHRRPRWWSRLTGRQVAAHRGAPVHP